MAIDIKFFNSFVLKKNINNLGSGSAAYLPVFPGLPNNPTNYPLFPTSSAVPGTGPGGRTDDDVVTANVRNWVVEESRIRGGFNETEVGYGVRAYLRKETSEQKIRTNAIIYSGIYNSNTGINRTNEFPIGEEITKAVDPGNGSIQKLHAIDTNMAIFQEDKVSRALIDKDAIYSAEGVGTPVSSTKLVIGQITPYVGEYGISKSPESFAYFGYRRYFTDKNRNAVMRLSNDGLTEISQYGLKDFFRDKLSEINDEFYLDSFTSTITASATTPLPYIRITTNLNKIEKGIEVLIPQTTGNDVSATVLGWFGSASGSFLLVYLDTSPVSPDLAQEVTFNKYIKDKVVGGFDNYNDQYTLSLQKNTNFTTPTTGQEGISVNYYTTSFDEGSLGWTSFYDYKPTFIFSLKSNFFTTTSPQLYKHYSNTVNRNNFYGIDNVSDITFIFNASPSIVKNFKTVNYEGSNGWQVANLQSDTEGFDLQGGTQNQYTDSAKVIKSYDEGLYTENGIPYRAGFNRKENKYFANLINNSAARPGEVFFGDATTGIKGYLATIKVSTDTTTDPGGAKELFAVSTEFVVSSR